MSLLEAEASHGSQNACLALLSTFALSAELTSRAFSLPFPSSGSPVPTSLGSLGARGSDSKDRVSGLGQAEGWISKARLYSLAP